MQASTRVCYVEYMRATPSAMDILLKPIHRWVWGDADRRARKLLSFAETESGGGRDLSRAAERTRDPSLRQLFLRHSQDEERHAGLFRRRGREILAASPRRSRFEANWLAPGERGLDELRVDGQDDESLLAFLHLSEKAAAGRFSIYCQVLDGDADTRALFTKILEDEVFHMSYTRKQLARLSPRRQGRRLWYARAGRLFKAYLRLANALASLLGTLMLGVQYFLLLPPFAVLAKRGAQRERPGFSPARAPRSLQKQY
jgi:rubrerythrin